MSPPVCLDTVLIFRYLRVQLALENVAVTRAHGIVEHFLSPNVPRMKVSSPIGRAANARDWTSWPAVRFHVLIVVLY